MCGIVGYVGSRQAQPILLGGLRQLEYRGYDSAGLATMASQNLYFQKHAGRVAELAIALEDHPLAGQCGISHTRWATHGAATTTNAHPHFSEDHAIAVVHNGVIENYLTLRRHLEALGYKFRTETDTEVIPHLIASHLPKKEITSEKFLEAIRLALAELKGTYGLLIIHQQFPELLVAARLGSPLVVGIGQNEHFTASDVTALLPHTKKVVYLEDGDIAVLTPHRFTLTRSQEKIEPIIHHISWQSDEVDKGQFEHFMKKEIFEQPQALENALRGRRTKNNVRLGGLSTMTSQLANAQQLILTGCGTSWHAALFGEYLIEELTRLPVNVEYASELRYRNAPIQPNTVLVCLSQSGETADTLAAVRQYKEQGVPTLGIVNVVGSSIAREAAAGIYLHAGPEIGVASTKAFTTQLTVLILLALHLSKTRHLTTHQVADIIHNLQKIPQLMQETFECEEQIKTIAKQYSDAHTVLYLGRGVQFPIALEGALKLKEVSYIHAEGYPAAEMKHGPIALVDKNTPSVILNPESTLYDKVMSNLEEIKARGGPIIAIGTEGDTALKTKADQVIYIPRTLEILQPLLSVIPLQLLAYHIALLRGCDVDKPRNLAKSVTVE